MRNNKGFTLSELLVTIVIIGVLSSIGIVSITSLRKNQEMKFNNTQLQLFKKAAQAYFTDNKDRLPLDFGEERVYLDELIKNNYIDKLLDYHRKEFNGKKSYVSSIKVFDKYIYTGTLVTNDNEIIDDSNDNNGSIKFEMLDNINCTKNNKYKEGCKGSSEDITEYYTNKKIKLKVILEDNKDKLFAYNYSIYKNGINIYTSEYVRVDNSNSYSDILTLNTDTYEEGKYRIQIRSFNDKYKLITKKTPNIYIDINKPICTTEGESTTWTKNDRILTFKCSDKTSGCVQESSTKIFNKTIQTATITDMKVKDKAGNETVCKSSSDTSSFNIYVDKTDNTLCSNNKGTEKTLCRRAKNLHKEQCSNNYASCVGDYEVGSDILYGNCGTKGQLVSGDAFDCDVNGDGKYDPKTERFYYTTDLDTNTAILLYYSNTENGVASKQATVAYYDENHASWYGPLTAIKQLPTIKQWSNVRLIKPVRAITTEVGTSTTKCEFASGGDLPTNFDYSKYAARMLTIQEILSACNISSERPGGTSFKGIPKSCLYMFENTVYASYYPGSIGWWTETPLACDHIHVYRVEQYRLSWGGYLSISTADLSTHYGTRPAIEVAKSNISY